MRTVVVTGAAGALGQRVVHRLAERDDVGRVVTVDVTPFPAPPPGVESHVMDLAGPGELGALFGDADGLVHLAWQVPERNGAVATRAAEANQRALRQVLAAAASAGTPAVVHLSSATVYGAWPDNKIPLTEDAPLRPNPGFRFAVGKAEAERLLAEWGQEHPGVSVAVLRPTVTVGSEGARATPRRSNSALYEALGGTRAPSSGDDPARPVQFLHVDDLASAVVHVWEQRLTGVFNVAPDGGIDEDTARSLAGGVAKVRLPSGWPGQ